MKVSFLTSSHNPKDDRIFYHQAKTVAGSGNSAEIISSKSELVSGEGNVSFNCFNDKSLSKKLKIERFIDSLSKSKPEIIICSEPLTILAAKRYCKIHKQKSKIVYDITEWYPSKKQLANYNILIKPFHAIKLFIINILMASKADAFIFGEWYKSKLYRSLFKRKNNIFLTYYPDLKYISPKDPKISDGLINLSYSGKLTKEKGFLNFLNIIKKLNKKRSELKINVKIIGEYACEKEKAEFEKVVESYSDKVSISYFDFLEFSNFYKEICNTDVFLDLRSTDAENQKCLPIKIFYYAALGRPVIYSELIAIRRDVDIDKFGYLVNPKDSNLISDILIEYINNKELYYKHCENAYMLSVTKYNWDKIKDGFIKFLYQIVEQ